MRDTPESTDHVVAFRHLRDFWPRFALRRTKRKTTSRLLLHGVICVLRSTSFLVPKVTCNTTTAAATAKLSQVDVVVNSLNKESSGYH